MIADITAETGTTIATIADTEIAAEAGSAIVADGQDFLMRWMLWGSFRHSDKQLCAVLAGVSVAGAMPATVCFCSGEA